MYGIIDELVYYKKGNKVLIQFYRTRIVPDKSKKPIYFIIQAFIKLICDPARIRTWDPQLRRLLLYPAELLDQITVYYFQNLINTEIIKRVQN